MKSTTILALASLALLACGGDEAASSGSTSNVSVPSMEEARKQAEEEIDAENVDEQLERLAREIETDG